MRLLLTILLLATLGAEAQQIGQNAPPGGSDTVTLSVRSQIVIETVVVKDKKGKRGIYSGGSWPPGNHSVR
jgi:hypothetical protein